MFDRQVIDDGGRIVKRVRECVRPQWQGFAFQRWRSDQHGQSVAQLEQRRPIACFAACDQFAKCGVLFVFVSIEQGQCLEAGRWCRIGIAAASPR